MLEFCPAIARDFEIKKKIKLTYPGGYVKSDPPPIGYTKNIIARFSTVADKLFLATCLQTENFPRIGECFAIEFNINIVIHFNPLTMLT